jgi:hypothetical protein
MEALDHADRGGRRARRDRHRLGGARAGRAAGCGNNQTQTGKYSLNQHQLSFHDSTRRFLIRHRRLSRAQDEDGVKKQDLTQSLSRIWRTALLF